jgi:uncharacterized protein (DUF58 family)
MLMRRRRPSRILKAPLSWLGRLPRPTGAGAAFCFATAAVGLLLLARPSSALLLTFCALLAAVLLSLLLPVLNLRGVFAERILPRSAYAGERFTATARIHRRGRRRSAWGVLLVDGPEGPYARPGVALALRVSGKDGARVRYRVRIKERGRQEVPRYRLTSSFPFGLFEHRVERTGEAEVLVYPRIGVFRSDPLPGSRFTRRMTTGETAREKGQEEFRNIREYRLGDNPRLIAWKASARHRELMVKELEDDQTKRVSIFLETRRTEESRSWERLRLERAISFAATLARRLARRRYHVQLFYFAPKPSRVSAGKGGRHLERVMDRLARLEPTPTGEMRQLIALAPAEALLRSLPVLVFPSLSERRLRAALGAMSLRHPPVTFHMDGEWERSIFGYHDDPFEIAQS